MVKQPETVPEQDDRTWFVTATDLRQWAYCPRVTYFMHFMPDIRPLTALMIEGQAAHYEEEERELRRTLSRFGLHQQAERHFRVDLQHKGLGLSGRIDLVLRLPGEGIPVEYKLWSSRLFENFKVQLAVYALLLEENGWSPVHRGFLSSIHDRRVLEVAITRPLVRRARKLIEEVRAVLQWERFPAASSNPRRCVNCEYRRFCNDIF